jgi:hypothetical protein
MEFISPDLEKKLILVKIEYFGGSWVGFLFFVFILLITGNERWLTKKRFAAMAFLPVIIPFVALTNEWHHLMWSMAWLDLSGPAPVVAYIRGLGFWVFVSFSYVLLLMGTLVLLKSLLSAQHLYRKQLRILLAGTLVPWISNALYLSGATPFAYLDMTPFAFMLTGLIMTWGLFSYRLLDIVPIAREIVLDGMEDSVIVLNRDDRIVDINASAVRLMG